ncbi:MAG: bifunctional riboflavin kinase/FAD synthetase [Candidatus Abyssobacteria bacterium SURF_5]|uniref:Riboflavin biosynthesis protein n=1 Tax=Abyssobacteria bacterium (strain SURF_5) TaxID=2093360 RepID=A0A3A4NVC0_ABYX5|nr:MAG: bifunctional riboflavin kinase/FAD synthetase [Candidatus Abyssubacteria bacterium SURF_5]
MLIFSNLDNPLPQLKNACVTLGVFDGVHLGHQKIIRRVLEKARKYGGESCVVTFDPHPREVLSPHDAPNLLTTTDKKAQLIEQLGIDALCLVRFTPEFANTEARAFVEDFLVGSLRMRAIIEGYNWVFGKGRKGNIALLDELSRKYQYEVEQVEPVEIEGQPISSTLIRELVLCGDLQASEKYLGRKYSITGDIVGGARLGREMGFPTANIEPRHEAIPPDGIYAVWVNVLDVCKPGTLNIGFRPTVSNERKRTIEVHIMDFYHDIYNEKVEVTFVAKLRDERKFPSVDALVEQIKKDVEKARNILVEQSKSV